MFLDRPKQLGARALDPIDLRNSFLDLEPGIPEAADNRLSDGADVQHMSRFQRPHLPNNSPRRQRVAEAEEIVDAVLVEIEPMIRKLAQCRDLRCEGEALCLLGEEQRLDAHRIAGERQALGELVPDRGRIHAFKLQPGIVTPADESGENRLGVAMVGSEGVGTLELAPDRWRVDDLSVEHDRIAAVGAQDRLVPAFDIDDAEPAHAEAEVPVGEVARVVRTAADEAVALTDQRFLGHRPPTASVPAGNAAHGKLLTLRLVSWPP